MSSPRADYVRQALRCGMEILKIPASELCPPLSRERPVVRRRDALCWFLRNHKTPQGVPLTYWEIGDAIGITHATVLQAIRRHQAVLDRDCQQLSPRKATP